MNSATRGGVCHDNFIGRAIRAAGRGLRCLTAALGLLLAGVALAAPTISGTSDTRQVLAPGQALSLNVTAAGSGTLSYQWYHNNRTIAGATSASVAVAQVGYADGGAYTVSVTDGGGTTMSAPMFVIVAPTKTQVLSLDSTNPLPAGVAAATTNAVSVVEDYGAVIAIQRDGTVQLAKPIHSWLTALTIPAGLTGVVAISGYFALTKDGTVTSLSSYYPVPANLTGVVAITRSYALKSDGTVVPLSGHPPFSDLPTDLAHVVELADGNFYSMALKSDGSVEAWGSVPWIGSLPSSLSSGVTAISAGIDHALALKSDGTVIALGGPDAGGTQVPSGLGAVRAVYAGNGYSIALKSNGSLVVWGRLSQTRIPTAATNVYAVTGDQYPILAIRDASGDMLPQITAQPVAVTACTGQTVDFSVDAQGGGLAYQWRHSGQAVEGATNATLELTANAAMIGSWDVTVTNAVGSVTSSAAELSIVDLASRSVGVPAAKYLHPGDSLTLAVSPLGTSTLTYQWSKDNQVLVGETAANLSRSRLSYGDAGTYAVTVSDGKARQIIEFYVLVSPRLSQPYNFGLVIVGDPLGSGPVVAYANVPENLDDAVAVQLGSALKSDGTLVVWSPFTLGARPTPESVADVANVVAYTRDLVLKSDGTVSYWSSPVGLYGNWGTVIYTNAHIDYFGDIPMPQGLSSVVSISAGPSAEDSHGIDDIHYLGLKADGTVIAWGGNADGESIVPDGLNGVVAVAAGSRFSLALKGDGTVVAWGYSGDGATAVPTGLANVIAIAAGGDQAVALKSDHTLVAWGTGPALPVGLANIRAVAVGSGFGEALKQDGTRISWGIVPMGVQNPDSSDVFSQVSCVDSYAAVLRDATGEAIPSFSTQPSSVVAVAGEIATFTCSVDAGGADVSYQWYKDGEALFKATNSSLTLYGVSQSDVGAYHVVATDWLGSTTSQDAQLTVSSIVAPSDPQKQRVVLSPGATLSLGGKTLAGSSYSYQWYKDNRPIAGAVSLTYVKPSVSVSDSGVYVLEVVGSQGTQHLPFYVTVTSLAQQVIGWGDNQYGQTSIPSDLGTVVDIASYGHYAAAVKADGTVAEWDSYVTSTWPPRPLPSWIANVSRLAMGYSFTVALKGDGTVTLWEGKGGEIDILGGIVAVAASQYDIVALRDDGTVVTVPGMAWDNGRPCAMPAPGNPKNVVAIAAGDDFALALKADGTVVAWGDNGYGQTTIPSGLTDVVAIAAGARHALALRRDGTVVAWGDDKLGQTDVPAGLGGVVSIQAGDTHSLAVKADGTVVAWGDDSKGATDVPAGLTHVQQVAAGEGFSMALRDASSDPLPAIATQSANQVMPESGAVTLSVSANGLFLSYQWLKNGVAIPGATSPSLTLDSIGIQDAGTYTVVVTGGSGSVTSAPITLTVIASNHLLALSTRCYIGTGDAIGVQGLILKQAAVVLLRAAGPSLANYNVSGVLQKPVLTLYDVNGKALVSDQGWQNLPTYLNGTVAQPNGDYGMAYDRSQVASAVQAFPFTSPDDSAIAIRLPAGIYTMQVSGADGTTGNAIMEAYFYSPPGDTSVGDRLTAVSTRCHVGTGDSIAIVGLSVNKAATMLLRAVGPSLANYQVSGVLAKPTMTVYDGSGQVVATNTGWSSDSSQVTLITQAEQQVGEFPLTSPDDSALVAGLKPGLYTIQVKGADGGSGNALVEAYFLHDGN